MGAATAYKLDFKPILLKGLAIACGIGQGELARTTGLSRPAINLALNRGYIPATCKDFKGIIERYIGAHPASAAYLAERNLDIKDIWAELGRDMRMSHPRAKGNKNTEARQRQATASGYPNAVTIQLEVEMVTQEAMRHFKVFRNPFIDDIQKDSDIYMSDEHRYIEAAMLDAARHGGFLAVIGEVGSGKSIMRRRIVEQLRKDGDVLMIYPQMVDKTRLSAASICDAIVMDISDEKPRIRLEQKTRQVQKLLLDRSKSGYRACLIIEEAHDLNPQTLKYLKRFYELEDGYKKLLGIILIGQPELKFLFNEAQHVDMREVIRRCQVAEIKGLNGNIGEYLALKFKRVGADMGKIFDERAITAISERLTSRDRRDKTISHAYPLLVNNYAARALNLACELGEAKVTADVVMAI